MDPRDRFKHMSGEKKLKLSLQLYWSARRLKEASIRQQHPDWTEAQVKEATRKAFLYARS